MGFVFIHITSIQKDATPQYRQLRKDFTCSYWFFNLLSYCLNFKMSLVLISYFCGRVRFAGKFSSDNW